MNALSWLIYLADASASADWWSFAIAVFAGGGAICSFALASNAKEVNDWDSATDDNRRYPSLYEKPTGERPTLNYGYRKYTKSLCILAAAMLVFNVVTPSRNTFYAIAASELGEAAMKSSSGTKAIKALDAWLDQQIEKATK